MTLPEFPKFENLSIHHKNAINSYFDLYPPYSDFTFATLWCWNLYDSAMLSTLNGNLVLSAKDYESEITNLSFLGNNESQKTVYQLLEYANEKLSRSQLDLVPEISLPQNTTKFTVELGIQEVRNNFDYVLDLQALASFAGSSFRSKHKLANYFERTYTTTVRELDLNNNLDREMILSAFIDWSKSRGICLIDNEKELYALKRVFSIWSTGAIVAIGVFSDNRLVAFSINEIIPNKFAVGLFLKADINMRGAFEYLRLVQVCRLLQLGCKWLNIEEDKGLPGLRQAKMSNHPIYFLRKYTIYQPRILNRAKL